MKNSDSKQTPSRLTRNILSGLLAAALISAAPGQLYAQDKSPVVKEVNVKYLGTIDNQPVVRIEFENPESTSYVLSIKDEDGNVLYTDVFKEQRFGKSFQFQRSDIERTKYTFTLSSSKQKIAQSFEVSTNLRTVQDVVVTKL